MLRIGMFTASDLLCTMVIQVHVAPNYSVWHWCRWLWNSIATWHCRRSSLCLGYGAFRNSVARAITSSGGYPIGPYIGDNSLSAWIGPNNDDDLNGRSVSTFTISLLIWPDLFKYSFYHRNCFLFQSYKPTPCCCWFRIAWFLSTSQKIKCLSWFSLISD